MHDLRLKVIITLLLVGFGFFIIRFFIEMLGPVFIDPMAILSLPALWTTMAFVLVVSVWIYALIKSIQGVINHLKFGSAEEQLIKMLDKEMKSLDVFMDVAQKEFMKRRISKQTYEDIQRIAGKKMVEIKAKKREISKGEPSKPSEGEPSP